MPILNQILDFILQTILGELVIVIAGVLFAHGIKRQYDNWRYGRYHIRIIKNNQELVNRPLTPQKAAAIIDEPVDLGVFLKGAASPFEWINCDIVGEGQEIGLLTIDREQRQFLINLDKNPPKTEIKAKTAREIDTADGETVILNFAHPITSAQQKQITALTGQSIAHIHDIPVHMENGRSFPPQIQTIINQIGLTSEQWQTTPLLINPPAYAPATAALLAELHGRIGHFPVIIRIRPVPNSDPTQFEVAELINLQTIRQNTRQNR